MLNLFRNKPEKQEQEKREQEQYIDFVTRAALPALKQGNAGYAKTLFRIFTIEEARGLHLETADALAGLLKETPLKNLMKLDEECRKYIMDWGTGWQKVDPYFFRKAREKLSCLSDEQYAAVLRFGTFHPDGYLRQICMEELAQYPDSLPFLAIRLNDWVNEIRNRASRLTGNRLSAAGILELFSAMPIFDRIRQSRRRDETNFTGLKCLLEENIRSRFQECPLELIHTWENILKDSVYRFLYQNKFLDHSSMERLCALEKSGSGKRLLILGIFRHFDCKERRILEYLSDKSAVVRYYALEHYYSIKKNVWPGLGAMLMDPSKRIRESARYILKKNSDFDVPEYYRVQLQRQPGRTAILGLGESGSKEDTDLILPYLEDHSESLAKAALLSYGMLAKEQGEALYWKYLLSSSDLLSRQAYRLIRKYNIHYGSGLLYETVMHNRDCPAAEKLLLLLTKEPSWDRLPYLLLLYDSEDLSETVRIPLQSAVRIRNPYEKIPAEKSKLIRSILEQKKQHIPVQLYDEIMFDLKYAAPK